MLRFRNVNQQGVLKVVKELDAFPKVPETYQETSASGGGLSIITFIVIGILVMSEVSYYTATELEFDYEVDTNHSGKVRFNVDMTVAMQCFHIGADILDQTGEQLFGVNEFELEPTYWELTEAQQRHQSFVQEMNSYLTEDYHAIHRVMWKEGQQAFMSMPKRDGPEPSHKHDACRVHGSVELNKVAGNFHIIAGKSIPVLPRGHAHLSMMMVKEDHNFSHRIEHISFGEPVAGVVYPLDGLEINTEYNYHTFQYFMQVVPTLVRTYRAHMDTYQFAVTEKNRNIDHSTGSHGNPGIFMKYDLTPLMIRVREVHRPYWQFLIRLCGIIGGVFCVSGMFHSLFRFIVDFICCKWKSGQKYEEASSALPNEPVYQQSPLLTSDLPSEGSRLLSNEVIGQASVTVSDSLHQAAS